MARRLFLVSLVLSLAALPVAESGFASGRPLTVYAAASLSGAFEEVRRSFLKSHPGMDVRVNYGASSTLRIQVEQGAPADVFASADHVQMEALRRAGLVQAPRTFARNRLVIVIPSGNPGRISTARDLARKGLRLIGTSQHIPVGRYTGEALRKMQDLPGFPPHFARSVESNIVSREANVRSLLAKVELGVADAAVVYETDARSSSEVRSVPIPAKANVTAEYPIAVLTAAANPGRARDFTGFALSRKGREILLKHGFR